MEPSWKQADAFPIIARIIEEEHRQLQRFVTSREIAKRLLQDIEGRNFVVAAQAEQEDKQSLELLAANMVAWFSQRITTGESDWGSRFDRTTSEGVWAYKPAVAGTHQ